MENTNIFTNIANKLKSFLAKPNDENNIDIQKTFSSENVDILPIIKIILGLSKEFPNNILNSKLGHKYNELEFFQSNQDSNSSNSSSIRCILTNISNKCTKCWGNLRDIIEINCNINSIRVSSTVRCVYT